MSKPKNLDVGLTCPHCGALRAGMAVHSNDSSFGGEAGRRRRRECYNCGKRYSTFEMIVPSMKRGPKRKKSYVPAKS